MRPDNDGDGYTSARTLPVADASRVAAHVASDDWERLQREYDHVIAFVMRRGASLTDAEDATQSAYTQAWSLMTRPGGWSRLRNPRAWIRVVAWNEHRRSHGPTISVPDVPESASSDDDPSALPALAVSVIAALARLKDDRVRLVMALSMDGLTAPEIAAALAPGNGPATPKDVQRVRDQLKDARRFIRYQLADPERW